jgi:hypothetical protein
MIPKEETDRENCWGLGVRTCMRGIMFEFADMRRPNNKIAEVCDLFHINKKVC